MLIDKWCIMFNIFKKKSTSEKTVANNRRFEINLIGSVLAYEVARSDGAVSEDELNNLVKEIDNLPERERLVLSLYYEEELNLKEIGLVLSVSESRVSQIHAQAAMRLRSRLMQWS